MRRLFADSARCLATSGPVIGLLFCTLAFVIGLATLAVVGTSMRMSGDDYCYAAAQVRWGTLGMIPKAYLNETPFSGNRYALTLFSGLAGMFPPGFNGLLPGIVLALSVMGTILFIGVAQKLGKPRLRPAEVAFLAVAIVFLTFYQAPDLAQSLYWRSGMLPYTSPIMLLPFLGLAVVMVAQRPRVGWRIAIPCLAAFLAAGLSEAAAMLQLAALSLALMAAQVREQKTPTGTRHTRMVLAACVATTILAILVLVLSPANASRLARRPTPPRPVEVVLQSIGHGLSFVRESLEGLPVPTGVTASLGFAFGLWVTLREPTAPRRTKATWAAGLLALPVGGVLLISATMVPSAYAQGATPEMRALILGRWVMVVALLSMGGLMGGQAAGFLRGQGTQAARLLAAAIFLASGAYSLRAVPRFLSPRPFYVRWAEFWDARDAQIQSLRERGVLEIEVVEIDHPIPRVGELSPDADYWYNNCAEEYYQVRSIRANQPGSNP